LAPSALRIPISRVRSVTDTSMMFMMTTPPTTSEMDAMPRMTAPNIPVIWLKSPIKVSLVRMAKESSAPGTSWRRARISARISSIRLSRAPGAKPAFAAISRL